jgi:cytochrome P450/NADPH-cytochrome P450 reductase
MIDERLRALGAQRVHARGEGDARDDFDAQWQAWHGPLWRSLGNALGLSLATEAPRQSLYVVELAGPAASTPFVQSFGAEPMTVVVNRELHRKGGTNPSERSTRHIELELPPGCGYRAGDHLGVIPSNSEALVARAAVRFGIAPGTRVRLSTTAGRKALLPVGEALPIERLLGDHVELQAVATRSQIETLVEYTPCPFSRPRLEALAGAGEEGDRLYRSQVLERRVSVLDLLEEFPACRLPLSVYLEMLPPLTPRYYSISSSPLLDGERCSITVALVEGPSRSGRGVYRGVCSTYLGARPVGSSVHAFVKDTKSAFRLPEDPQVSIIMIGPGTGLAPFRGFLQERAALAARGHAVAPSLLFFGCRHPEQDHIYEEELRAFERAGIVRLFTAFSRWPPCPKTYVQDLIRRHADAVWDLLDAGAIVYVCGDASGMAPDVRRTFEEICAARTGAADARARQWLEELANQGRYLVDVWAAS